MPESSESSYSCSIYTIDEGSSVYSKLGNITLDADSTYAIHPTGKVKKLLVAIAPTAATVGAEAEFSASCSAQFNVPIPAAITKKRLLLLFTGSPLLYALRPKSGLYQRTYESEPFLAGFCPASMMCALAIVATHYGYIQPGDMNYRQYIELAKAFANGQLFVSTEPSAALLAMDNPYDTNARLAANVKCLWDYAYFNEHYYVYFGVLPALLYQSPFYLLTGKELPVVVDVVASSVVFCCGAVFLLKKICDRWFQKISQGFFFILPLVLLIGSWAAFFLRGAEALRNPDHHRASMLSVGTGLMSWRNRKRRYLHWMGRGRFGVHGPCHHFATRSYLLGVFL